MIRCIEGYLTNTNIFDSNIIYVHEIGIVNYTR